MENEILSACQQYAFIQLQKKLTQKQYLGEVEREKTDCNQWQSLTIIDNHSQSMKIDDKGEKLIQNHSNGSESGLPNLLI
jgi:hypothetical protein